MRGCTVRAFITLAGVAIALAAQPVSARRTVYDTWGDFQLSGYCSPNTAGTADCAPYSMPFSVQIGGSTYNSFYVNSNGTLSFGSIATFLAPENSYSTYGVYTGPPPQTDLSAYSVPIFSPNFSDGPGYPDDFGAGFDGNFDVLTSVGTNSITVNWSNCYGYPLSCGLFSEELVASATYDPTDTIYDDLQWIILTNGETFCPCTSPEQQFLLGQQYMEDWILNNEPIYTMTLTDLPNGFRVDYSYDPAATGQVGIYGFSLPSGTDQVTGPLQHRTYFFNSLGELISAPEPATWMTMILGFGLMGFALRRQRQQQPQTG